MNCFLHTRPEQNTPGFSQTGICTNMTIVDLIPYDTPKLPLADVTVDLFTFDSDNYVVTAEYFSDFFVLEQLQDTTTTSVVEMLKR